MEVKLKLSCSKCKKDLEKVGSFNDPHYVNYECPKCKILISQECNIETGLCNWENKVK